MDEEGQLIEGLGGEGSPTWEYVPDVMQDKDIEVAVHNALLLDPVLEVTDFLFRSEDGVVGLHGRVNTEDEHRRAVDLVLGLPGVKRVEDWVEVLHPEAPGPPQPEDLPLD